MLEKKVNQSSGYDDETLTKFTRANEKVLRKKSGVRVYKSGGKFIISGKVPNQHYGNLNTGDEFLVEKNGSNWNDIKLIY